MSAVPEWYLVQSAADFSPRRASVRDCGRILAAFAGLGLVRVCGRQPWAVARPAAWAEPSPGPVR
eukprot:13212803-Alexandrium_andersonii.AAC.1